MLRLGDLSPAACQPILQRYGITLHQVPQGEPIPGSFWGEPEAGIKGMNVFVRDDTPVHSLLHEICHIICMTPARRASLDRNAGGSDLEESGVCYLQVLLAGEMQGVGRSRMMRDMDCWGYSFRLGNTAAWFDGDAEDARAFLTRHRVLTAEGRPSFRCRKR